MSSNLLGSKSGPISCNHLVVQASPHSTIGMLSRHARGLEQLMLGTAAAAPTRHVRGASRI